MKKLFSWLANNKIYFYTIAIVIVAFSFLVNVIFTIQLKYDNTALNDEIFELENRLKSTHQELEKSKTDIYIHQEATERLGLVESDELPVKITIVDNDDEGENKKEEVDMKDQKLEVFLQEWYADLKQITNK